MTFIYAERLSNCVPVNSGVLIDPDGVILTTPPTGLAVVTPVVAVPVFCAVELVSAVPSLLDVEPVESVVEACVCAWPGSVTGCV